jgi:DNA-binding MarR family transcriptional regulator
VLEEEAGEIRAAVLKLARRMRTERPAGALSSNKVAVLGYLRRNGPSTPGQLAAADGQQPQSLTRVFTELQRDGHIVRTRSPRDGRAAVLTLTDAGARALRADMQARDGWLADALVDLSDAERALLRVAAALLDRLASRDEETDT